MSKTKTKWIEDGAVTNPKLASMATSTLKGRATAGTGDPEDLAAADVRTILNVADGADVTDATSVNAAGAIMHSDISTTEGYLRKTAAETYVAVKSNLAASAAPGTSDDNTAGYAIGSVWIDTTNDNVYTCVDASTGAAVWKPHGGSGGGGNPASSIVEATADTTTTSGTDGVADSMTVTPAAGTYAVWFSGSIEHSSNNSTINLSIYSGGSQVAASERLFRRGAGQGDVATTFTCMAKVTVNGSQAIEGQWRTSSSTATMHQRQLLIVAVS